MEGVQENDVFIPVTCLPLGPKIIENLETCGLFYIEDLDHLKADELQRITQFPLKTCDDILNCTKASPPPVQSLFAKLQIEAKPENVPIVTGAKNLDAMLNGGISFGKVTEIYGEAGSGKTQICFQLAVNVQIPEELGGPGGEAIFIDTEGTFRSERVQKMALSQVEAISEQLESNTQDALMCNFSVKSVTDHIYLRACETAEELFCVISNLSERLENLPKVRLIIIDSIAYYFRYYEDEDPEKTRKLMCIAHMLKVLASRDNLAVVVVNQVSQKPGSGVKKPALGDSWSHTAGIKVELRRDGLKRVATLRKSLKRSSPLEAIFSITDDGIIDAV